MYIVSVIIANYNSGDLLKDTLYSLSKCNLENDCISIIDNNSLDGSFELSKNILKEFKNDKFFIQEKDEGIYDALNKGIKNKNAEYILILHSGDLINPKSYNLLKEIIKGNFNKEKSKIIIFSKGISRNYNGIKIFNSEVEKIRFRMSLVHSNVLISKHLYEKHGYYDERFKISGDFYLIRKLLIAGEPFITLNLSLISSNDQGLSNKFSSLRKIYRENLLILKEGNLSKKEIIRFLFYILLLSISILKKKFIQIIKYNRNLFTRKSLFW